MALVDPRQTQLTPQFNLGQSFAQGQVIGENFRARQEQKRKDRLRPEIEQLRVGALGGDEQSLQRLGSISPEDAQLVQKQRQNENILKKQQFDQLDAENKTKLESAVTDSVQVSNIPDKAGKMAFLEKRIEQIRERGGDSSDSERVLDMFLAGQDDQANAEIQGAIQSGRDLGIIDESGVATSGTASQKDLDTFLRLQKTNPDLARRFGRKIGLDKESFQEKSDIKVSEAGRKATAKGVAERKQGFIDSGIEAADNVGTLNRTIELLDSVKTGGFEQAKLKAKQAFGIESADEAELSANLGRNVLAQLKPIFGAAFTEGEGQRLTKIEAGFGKSAEGNKRLLQETLKISERAARRGLKAAEEAGDEFTANEIRKSLEVIKDAKQTQKTKEKTEPAQDDPLTEAELAELAELEKQFGGQ